PVNRSFEEDLAQALSCAICDPISADIPLLERESDMLRISFEGSYFPLDEVLAVFKAHLLPNHKGKLDVLDLDGWRITRFQFLSGHLSEKNNSLNSVLDYNGF
ncbi:MAG: hypothetical protein IK079_00380, partial [Desulfovibrio sp.]|nr:hypothetical protein [Desulfovibrio sp.]